MAARITQQVVLVGGKPTNQKARVTQVVILVAGPPIVPEAGRNYGFWGRGAIGSPGGPNVGVFGD